MLSHFKLDRLSFFVWDCGWNLSQKSRNAISVDLFVLTSKHQCKLVVPILIFASLTSPNLDQDATCRCQDYFQKKTDNSNQSGRSPKVVALFLLQTLVAIWYDFFQLHDTIKMKPNHTGINYNHNSIAIRSHIMMYNSVQNLILLPNLVAFILQKDKNVWFFNYHLLTCSVRKMVLICLMQNINMC